MPSALARPMALAANEPWEEQGLFCSGVKRLNLTRLSGRRSLRGNEAFKREVFKARLGLGDSLSIGGIETKAAVTCVVHHDLGRHEMLRKQSPP